jgi:hypothetical protein
LLTSLFLGNSKEVCAAMAPRTNWKGYLKLSLVSGPVALYPAAAGTSERVTFHVLNRSTVVPTWRPLHFVLT